MVPGITAFFNRRTVHRIGSSITPIRNPDWAARIRVHRAFSPLPGTRTVPRTLAAPCPWAKPFHVRLERKRRSHRANSSPTLSLSPEMVVMSRSDTKALVAFSSQTLPVDRLGPPNPRRILVIDYEADIRES